MWSFPIYAIFTFPVRFCQFLPIRHLTGDIAPLLHSIFLERFVIFRQFCHSHVACPIFALFPRLSYNQGHLSGILFNFRYLVIFWSDLPFSPFWSGFGIFYQIRYFTKKSFGASFQFASTLWWFFLPNSQLFALLTGSLRFRRIRHLVRLTLWPGTSHGVLWSPYLLFSTFVSGFGRFCQFAIWPGISHWASITYSSNVLWSFAISVILTLPVRFSPFFPDCHFTMDISRAFYSISAIW